jgi:oligoribonuclease NrnB/cAMP/cGMP phosphodiesterase (DHH superfamily)
MNNELIIFTHNDLDAITCALNIEYKMPSIAKKYFYTNYQNIHEIVTKIEKYISEHNNTHLLITDVSFSDNKSALRQLYKMAQCTFIDHHLYPDGFWDEFPNMKVRHDVTKCAAKLCNEYFGNKGKNSNLDKLTFLCDVYDIWQTKSPAFDIAQDLNNYFWQFDFESLRDRIIENNYDLPSDFKDVVTKVKANANASIMSFEERKLIQRNGDVAIAFVNDYFNEIMIKEMKNGKNIVIGATGYGIIKVRIKEGSKYSKAAKNSLRLALTGTENIGHENAFTYKIKSHPNFKNILIEIEKITRLINELT